MGAPPHSETVESSQDNLQAAVWEEGVMHGISPRILKQGVIPEPYGPSVAAGEGTRGYRSAPQSSRSRNAGARCVLIGVTVAVVASGLQLALGLSRLKACPLQNRG